MVRRLKEFRALAAWLYRQIVLYITEPTIIAFQPISPFMKNSAVLSILLVLSLSACSSIRVENVTQVPRTEIVDEFVVIKDSATRETVLPVIENHLAQKGFQVRTVQSVSEIDPEDYAIKYRAWWSWDLALYMSRVHMEVLHGGAIIGSIDYEGKGGLNTNKWGNGERRLEIIIDTLLNDITVQDANKRIQ